MTTYPVGTRFTIPHGSPGIWEVKVRPDGRIGVQDENQNSITAFMPEQIERAFNLGTWVKLPEETAMTDTVTDRKPAVGERIKVTGVPGYRGDEWRSRLPETTDDIHVVIEPPYTHDAPFVKANANENAGGAYYVTYELLDAEGSATDEIDALRREITSLNTLIEAGNRNIAQAQTEIENLKRSNAQLSTDKVNYVEFRADMLSALAMYAENPECGCDKYCDSFNAWMIRRGYTRAEVDEARDEASPMETHDLIITVTGRAGSGGISALAATLMEKANEYDGDWTGTAYDYNDVSDNG